MLVHRFILNFETTTNFGLFNYIWIETHYLSIMSSTEPESLKKPSEESAANEPSSKKAKISDNENASEAATKTDIDQNDNIEQRKNPNKSLNGSRNENDPSPAGYLENENAELDPKFTNALEEVESIQSELFKLNEKASEEILKVEQKFNQLRRPHFAKRAQILESIPHFWSSTLANHPIISPMIESAEDEDCLHYLVDLDVEEFEDIKSGYRINLHFKENPYFTNDVIVKEFQVVSSDETTSALTTIEFKNTPQGRSLKQVVENSVAQYSRRSRRPGQPQTHQSFFAWLAEPSEPGTDEIAEILKDQIWPNPLEFFFTVTDDYDDESDEDEEIDDEELDDEEDGVIAEAFDDEELEGDEDEDEEDVDEDGE